MARGFAATAVSAAGAAIDRAALRVMERAMSRSGPRRSPADAGALLVSLADHYGRLGDDFFAPPPAAIVTESVARRGKKTVVVDISFASEYQSSLESYGAEFGGYAENHTARARLFSRSARSARSARSSHGSPGRPTLIAIHGWGAGQYWFEERAFQVGRFLEAGYDVALFQLPFHYQRAPAAAPRSGALFPSPHVVRTNEAFGQAIWDLRRLAIHLRRARGVTWLGAIGMSLGGYTTALWASLDDSLAAAVTMIPAVSMADLMWRHGEKSPLQARAREAGVNRELLANVFAVHAPLSRPPAIDRRRLMIVAGRGDKITPRDQVEDLWAHWNEPRIHWFAGGHLAQVGRGRAFSAVRDHLKSTRS